MVKFVNAVLVLAVLVSASFLYSLEHATRGKERQIAKLNAAISEEREATKVLSAEWSSLTRPDRLQKLSEQHLKLKPVAADQIVAVEELAQRLPDAPVVKPVEDTADPIGAILKEMQ